MASFPPTAFEHFFHSNVYRTMKHCLKIILFLPVLLWNSSFAQGLTDSIDLKNTSEKVESEHGFHTLIEKELGFEGSFPRAFKWLENQHFDSIVRGESEVRFYFPYPLRPAYYGMMEDFNDTIAPVIVSLKDSTIEIETRSHTIRYNQRGHMIEDITTIHHYDSALKIVLSESYTQLSGDGYYNEFFGYDHPINPNLDSILIHTQLQIEDVFVQDHRTGMYQKTVYEYDDNRILKSVTVSDKAGAIKNKTVYDVPVDK